MITSNDRNLWKLTSGYSLFKIWRLYAVTYYKSFWKCTIIFLTANVLMDTVDAICQYYTSRFHQVFSAKGRKLVHVGKNATMVTLTSYFIRIQPCPCHLSFHINLNEFPLNTTLTNISEVWPSLIPHNFSNFVHAWIITPCHTTADIHDCWHSACWLVYAFAYYSNVKNANDSAHILNKILKATMMPDTNLEDDDGNENPRKTMFV